MRVPCIRV